MSEHKSSPIASIWNYLFHGGASSSASTLTTSPPSPILATPADKVIAMKKIEGTAGVDDFIDIQVRKLSYAEAASLSLVPSNAVVIDQDKDLGKAVTDVEFADAYKRQQKFNPERLTKKVAVEELEDDDLLPQKRIPKRFRKAHPKHV